MSTSKVLNNLSILSSISVHEQNNASTSATDDTVASGIFLSPSNIDGRPEDVTGMVVVSATDQGKLGFTPTDDLEATITPTGTTTQVLISDPITLNTRAGGRDR